MVAPLAAMAAVAAVSAIAQAYQSEKARGANQKRLDELERSFAAIVPPAYDVSINDPPQYMQEKLRGADFDFSRITPEAYKTIGTYSPEAAAYVREQNPQLAELTAAGQEGRQSQLDALRQYKKIAAGKNPELDIRLQQAGDAAQAQAQSRSQSALEQAQRQGRGGSGLTFAAALQGGSDAMQSGALQGQQAALAAYQAKMGAVRESGQMGRQLAQDDLGQQSRNADVINAFNERTSRNYQAYLQQRANMVNDAQRFNLEQNQRTADMNTRQNNESDRYNLEGRNRLAQQDYENRRGERNYQDSIAERKADWARDEKNRQNDLKQRGFTDQMNVERGRQGLGAMQMDMTNQTARDRNQIVQGIANAGGSYYGAQAQKQAQNDAYAREDKRWADYMSARYPKNRSQAYQEADDFERERYMS